MKIATVEVVPPNICKEVDIGEGISIPTMDSKMPEKIDIIKGFLESLFATCFNPFHIVDSSSLYNSRIVMEIVTLIIAIVAADNVARCSPFMGKANVMKGIPKKARLPKMVLRMSKYRVLLENPKIK